MNIGACIESVKQQTYKNIEVIIVDNNSSDKTKEIAKYYGVTVYDKGPERSAQRNFGAKKAKGEYLLFLDADMILTLQVVEQCIKILEKDGFQALVIPEKSIGTGFWTKCKALERSFYEGVDWIEAARFFDKKAFRDLGGYDEKLTGPEDFDLPQRLKLRFGIDSIGRVSSYIHHNEGILSLKKTLRKKFYYGKKMALYMKKKENKSAVVKQGNIFRRFGLFFAKPAVLFHDPVVGLGMLYMKTLEMVALALGALSSKI